MRGITQKEMKKLRTDTGAISQKDCIEWIQFCIRQLYRDKKHTFQEEMVRNLCFEEVLGALMGAEDYINSMEEASKYWVRRDMRDRDKKLRNVGSGFVYIMKYLDKYKVGCSDNPERRLNELNKTSVIMPYQIELIKKYWCEDMYKTEKALHDLLDHRKCNGEWYDLNEEELHAIDILLKEKKEG